MRRRRRVVGLPEGFEPPSVSLTQALHHSNEGAKDESVALRLLAEVWSAIHTRHLDHDEGSIGGPDSFYNGMQTAAGEVLRIAREHGIDASAIYQHHAEDSRTLPLSAGEGAAGSVSVSLLNSDGSAAGPPSTVQLRWAGEALTNATPVTLRRYPDGERDD